MAAFEIDLQCLGIISTGVRRFTLRDPRVSAFRIPYL